VLTAGELQVELGNHPLLVRLAGGEEGEEEDAEEDKEEEIPKYEEAACTSFSAEKVFVGSAQSMALLSMETPCCCTWRA